MIKHNDIFLPVKKQLQLAMALISLAQVIKLSIWLIMVWIVYALMQDPHTMPFIPILALLVCSMTYYTLKIYASDKSHYAAYRLEEIIRARLTKKISQLPTETVRSIGSGNLTKTLIDDVRELHAFVADSPPLKAEAYVTPIYTFIVLFIFNWFFALIVLLLTTFTFAIFAYMMIRGRLKRQEYNQATVDINSAIIEYVQGMSTVRTFDAGESSYSRYQLALERYKNIILDWTRMISIPAKLGRSLFAPMPMLMCLLVGFTIAHFYFGISITTVFCFLLMAVGVAESMHPMMGLLVILEKSKAAIERIFEIDNLPILPETTSPNTVTNNHISYEQVSFAYQGTSKKVLSGISFDVPEHSFTAIIGSSGSGKTTLVNLLPRFLDVTDGAITLGGTNIKELAYAELISKISIVFQDNFLFSCSIADNIRYGLDGISDEQVIEAAKKAEIHDFIMTLPEQYQTMAGERGQLLSGGQKQRISIARAFLQDRPIIILDEPTAFADAKNEALLLRAFDRLIASNKTVIMVAHRLSSIVKADQIILIAHGEMLAKGDHHQLLQNSADYQKLWQDYQRAQAWAIPTQVIEQGGV